MIGEVVMHGFDFFGNLEIGFRIEKKNQKKGYAFESVSALIEYIEKNIKPKKIKAKCYLENEPSKKLLEKLGFSLVKKDKTYYYFEKKINSFSEE